MTGMAIHLSSLRLERARVRSRLIWFVLVLTVLPSPTFAQIFDMEKNRVPMTVLDGPVRFHTGDDEEGKFGWASPGFDDSSWALIGSARSWGEQGYKSYGGFAWYRFRVVLPQKHRRLALYIPLLQTSFQVFADGLLIGQVGGLPPHESIHFRTSSVFLLPAEATDSVVIAIRVWHWPHWAMYRSGGFNGAPRIGEADFIADWQSREFKGIFWSISAQDYQILLEVLAGIAGLVLYLLRRKEREYLWFGAYQLLDGATGLVQVYMHFHDSRQFFNGGIAQLLSAASLLCFIAFLFLILRSRRSKWYWVAVVSVVLFLLILIPASEGWISVSLMSGLQVAFILPYAVTILALLIQGSRRRDPDAQLLLIPVGLNAARMLVEMIVWAAAISGLGAARELDVWLLNVTEWPFPVAMSDITDTIMQLSIFGILLLRFARSRRDEERLKSELEAARAVQQVLVPEEIPTIPGFAIEAVYHPAGQVGGDFFQVIPAPSDSVLVVIGDVSGKGMPAAMTVSLLVGTVRTLAHYTQSPAEILTAMNQRIIGRSNGGFTTSMSLRIDDDGVLTIANAGHLAPYNNGQELSVENGLPLGLASDAAYKETRLHLAPGDTLTLLSDGVVEAQSVAGELFGFERTAAISTEPAEKVAQAARAFGQQDDITVLRLTFVPVPVLRP
jgi:hypothetical protein